MRKYFVELAGLDPSLQRRPVAYTPLHMGTRDKSMSKRWNFTSAARVQLQPREEMHTSPHRPGTKEKCARPAMLLLARSVGSNHTRNRRVRGDYAIGWKPSIGRG